MALDIIQNNFLTSNPQHVDQEKNLSAVLVSTFPEEKIKKKNRPSSSNYYQPT